MRTWIWRNLRKSPEAAGGFTEMLFNVSAVLGFPKKSTVSERDIQIAEETLLNIPLILMSYQYLIQN